MLHIEKIMKLIMNNIYKNSIIVFLILLVLFIPFFSSDKTDFREPKVVNDESIG